MANANSESLPVAFRDVDATKLDKIVRCLEGVAALPTGREYKALALSALQLKAGATALDVACGLGQDVAEMQAAGAKAVGVDMSRTLIDAARSRHATSGCTFEVSDAKSLPFDNDKFDAVRIDRSLQHIAEPGAVVREMARVARPGGVVLCAEPDWGTFMLGGPHSEVVERFQHDWIRTFQNPWIGRTLTTLLRDAGVRDVQQEAVWLSTQGFAESDLLFEVDAGAHKLSAEFPDALAWLDTYKSGEAYAGVLMIVAWGRK